MNDQFVNPYSFVPFPTRPDGQAAVDRDHPAGHDRLAEDHLGGSISVTWTARTPAWFDPEPRGSAIKGAVRSLHETLAGGCLRIVDQDFIPTYRDQARPLRGRWALLRVSTVENGAPFTGHLAEQPLLLDVDDLWDPGPGGAPASRTVPTTGSFIGIVGQDLDVEEDHGRSILIGVEEVFEAFEAKPDEGAFFSLVTPAEPRATVGHPYRVAVGRYAADDLVGVTFEGDAWKNYLAAASDTEDQRRVDAGDLDDGARDELGRLVEDVKWMVDDGDGRREKVVGRRRLVTREVVEGDVLWVRIAKRSDRLLTVAEVRASVIWRHPGRGPAGQRFPEGLEPCSDPEDLCPSCRIFGSADTAGPRTDHDQRSYRGHVRFGPLERKSAQQDDEPTKMAPLGRPRPGAGQFYLKHRGGAAERNHLPAREWGSTQDKGPRPFRGRKYYWPADPTVRQPSRHQARLHHDNALITSTRLWRTGSTWTSQIRFLGLSEAEVGGLLVSLCPALVLGDELPAGHSDGDITVRLGRGKPLGLGVFKTDLELATFTGHERWTGTESRPPIIDDLVAAFVASVPPEARKTWPDLAAMLHTGHVDPRLVWYPPGKPWNRLGSKEFDEPFEFFKYTSGETQQGTVYPMPQLPPPRRVDQALPIKSSDNRPPNRGNRR